MTKTRILAVTLAVVMVFAISGLAFSTASNVSDEINFGNKTWYVLSDGGKGNPGASITLMAKDNAVSGSTGISFGGTGDYAGSNVQEFLKPGGAFEAEFSDSILSVINDQVFTVGKYASLSSFNSNGTPLSQESITAKFRLLNKAEYDSLGNSGRDTVFKGSDGNYHEFFLNGLTNSAEAYYAHNSGTDFTTAFADVTDPTEEYEVLPVIKLNWDNITQIGDTLFPNDAESDNADLFLLSVSDGDLDPVFAPATTNYEVIVWGIDEITITAIPEVGSIKAGSDLGLQDLVIGDNVFKITVVAPDGVTEKTYTVTVKSYPDPLLTIGGNTHYIWPVPAATETVFIPVAFHHSLADLDGILNLVSAGYWFTITYDTDMLEFTGPYTDSNPERIIVINHHPDDPEGTLRVVYNATFDSSLNPVLNMLKIDDLLVPFKVIGNPARNDETILEISNEMVLDGNIEKYDFVTTEDVTVIFTGAVRKLGDVNNDDEVTPEDAILLLQWLVGLPTPSVVWDAETLWAANVKGYGDPDVTDAALILRMVVGG